MGDSMCRHPPSHSRTTFAQSLPAGTCGSGLWRHIAAICIRIIRILIIRDTRETDSIDRATIRKLQNGVIILGSGQSVNGFAAKIHNGSAIYSIY